MLGWIFLHAPVAARPSNLSGHSEHATHPSLWRLRRVVALSESSTSQLSTNLRLQVREATLH